MKLIHNVTFMIKKLFAVITNKNKQLQQYPIIQLIFLSILLNFGLEALSRRSILKSFAYIVHNPLMLLFNILIILFTLSFSLLFKRRKFVLCLIVTIWLALGIGDFVVLGYRTTPLSAVDFLLLGSVSEIIKMYLKPLQMILVVLGVALVTVLLVILWRRLPKEKAYIKKSIFLLGVTGVFMLILSFITFAVHMRSSVFGNLVDAYSDYGFAYCFSMSIFDRGINEPDEYSEENIDAVLKSIENTTESTTAIGTTESQAENTVPEDIDTIEQPNVVFVQLESFFDVNDLVNFSFSEDPIPNFNLLKKNFSWGYLTVPSIGAGTANTEFEILTGMNLEYFGAGEYPYKTILQSMTCESMAYNYDALGYSSHAIHNNTGTFYDRHKIFKKLGFDTFTSSEYMCDIEYNPLGWPKDEILTDEIIKSLQSTEERDFVFAISVQPHGKYPEEVVDEDQTISVIVDPNKKNTDNSDPDADFYYEPSEDDMNVVDNSVEPTTEAPESENAFLEVDFEENEIDMNEGYKNGIEYYVNQLYETDQFIADLTNQVRSFQEPTVIVFYGDHLPSFSIEDEDLVNLNKFQTEYVIWSNFSMEQEIKDIQAYRLSSYVMERIGFDSGILTKYHQRYVDQPDYQAELEMLQYDMLYGDQNAYQGENPFVEKELHMGVNEVVIGNVEQKGDVTFVEGENFTMSSVVLINDEAVDTYFVDHNTLIILKKANPEDHVKVAQMTKNDYILSESNEWGWGSE